MGALVPGRLHRRGGGPAPRVVLRAALHVHRPGGHEPLPDGAGARAGAGGRRARDAQELGQRGLARRRPRAAGPRRDPAHVRVPGHHGAAPLRPRGSPGRQAAVPDVLERLQPVRHLREPRPAPLAGTGPPSVAGGAARAMAAEPAAGHHRRGAAGPRHVSDPPGRRRGRRVHPRRSVELVRAPPATGVLEGHPRPREAGRVPGPLPRAGAGVPAPRSGHAVRHRARLPEPGARGVAGRAGQPPPAPLPGARSGARAARAGSRGGGGATGAQGGAGGPQRRPPQGSASRSGGRSWWHPPRWSTRSGRSSRTSSTS